MSDEAKFGFDSLQEIRPRPAPNRDADMNAVDRVAENVGFGSREPQTRRRRKTVVQNEPSDQFNLRASVVHINRFVAWCEREGISYRQGFGRLVEDLPEGGGGNVRG